MKLGILLAGRRPEDIGQRLEQAREAGFFLCQLNLHQTGYTREDIVAIADLLDETGIRAASIGCYVNPLRPDDAALNGVRRADLELVLSCLDLLGARRVVFWSGTHGRTLYEPHPENATEASEDSLRAFLTSIVQYTRARHYYLVIEPWRTHVLNDEGKMTAFYRTLAPTVQARVRYVLDAPNLIGPDRYPERNRHAEAICQTIGPLAGVAHLKDCIMPPDAEEALPGPGKGALDYPAYLQAILQHAPPDCPAIMRNVPAAEYAETRDYLLRLSDRWELV